MVMGLLKGPTPGGNGLLSYTQDARGPLESFHPVDPAANLPYAGGEHWVPYHVVGDTVIAGSSLGYPLRIYALDGDSLGEFGEPSPSFRRMRHPQYGEFVANPVGGQEWVRSFTRVSSVWVAQDSLVLVEHLDYDPDMTKPREARYTMDVYDRQSLTKIAEDVHLPGFIAASREGRVWLLTGTPPEPWTLTAFRIDPKTDDAQ